MYCIIKKCASDTLKFGANAKLEDLSIGNLLLDKYGRLGYVINILCYEDTGETMYEIEWLRPQHGKMLVQPHKADEWRRNFLFLKNRFLNDER